MSFMIKKKRFKFNVHLCVEDLTAVPFLNAVLFVKVRLLDGGTFSQISSREQVREHTVRWDENFQFVCKMSANASTGVLDPCNLRISVRKESKGGRTFQKLGFIDLNLAELAGCGETTRRCLLEGYDSKYRQDNSMLRININMNMLSGDVLFKVPSQLLPSSNQNDDNVILAMQDRLGREDFPPVSISSSTSSFGSISKKRPPLFERLNSENSSIGIANCANSDSTSPECHNNENNDALSKVDDNESVCHAAMNPPGLSSSNKCLTHSRHSSCSDSANVHARGFSGTSCLSETGSLDRGKLALERRRKAAEENVTSGRVEITRVNTDTMIEQLIRSTNLELTDDSNPSAGLQLFISKDGTTTLGGQDVKHQPGVFKKVVMEEQR